VSSRASYACVALGVFSLVSTGGVLGCRDRAGSGVSADGRMLVAASIYPIADILRHVGGERHVRVLTLLPPGGAAKAYTPTEGQSDELARARLLVVIGLGLDDWARRGVPAEGGDGPRIVDLSTVVGCPSGTDPYVWLDPVKMIRMVEGIAKALSDVDPEGASRYASNAAAYQNRLRELDRLCAKQLESLPRKAFVTLDPTFGHFAARYGLKQIAVPEAHVRDAERGEVKGVIAFLRKHQAKCLFADPGFSVDPLDAIVEQANISFDRLDPLGTPGISGHGTYIDLMKTNLDALVEGLSG